MKHNIHYQAIKQYYGARQAKRSRLPLMNHIDEGLALLDHMNASQKAKQAFCIHPLLQSDSALTDFLSPHFGFSKTSFCCHSVILAMEYRAVANSYLLAHCIDDSDVVQISSLACVNHMLIADKVQNKKDFDIYHFGTHPKSAHLTLYFQNWFRALRISEQRYQQLVTILASLNNEALR